MDNKIKEFLAERKAVRIKQKTKLVITEEERFAVEQEAEAEFSLDNWLPDAAKRACQLSLVSHPGKFSHPGSKTSPILAISKKNDDGFLRTGNVSVERDVSCGADVMPVYKFLSIKLSDEKTVLEHIEEGSAIIREQLKIKDVSFEQIQQGFLAIKQSKGSIHTSGKVKQVFFPIQEKYHLLSILTPSGLMFKLKDEIDNIRFSEQAKKAKEDKKKQLFNENGFSDISNLSVIGFGGAQPQNISVLNSKYGGKSYLLSCLPPEIDQRAIRLPKNDFFKNNLWPKDFSDSFLSFHKLIASDCNNINIRDARDRIIKYVIDQIIEKVWAIRSHEEGWSATKNYAQLPIYQKIWLDSGREADRETNDEWIGKVITDLARWFIFAYREVKGAKLLADDELAHIKKIITQGKEGLI